MTFKKKLTNLFNAINLMDFRGKREAFYEQLAKSIENKEQFKTFLEEELKLPANKPNTQQQPGSGIEADGS